MVSFFYVHPYSGKISNLTNICQMGWNHQLDKSSKKQIWCDQQTSNFVFRTLRWIDEYWWKSQWPKSLQHCLMYMCICDICLRVYLFLYLYIYIYIYVWHMSLCVFIYIYIYNLSVYQDYLWWMKFLHHTLRFSRNGGGSIDMFKKNQWGSLRIQQWKKPWLFRLYRGLYYPAI